jgi:mannose-6-phosphate isomerase-like protein (cupin superfamily)
MGTRRPSLSVRDQGKRLNVFADVITVKLTSEDTNGAYALFEDVTPPGAGVPHHIHHREDEVFNILEGEYEVRCDDRVFKALAGSTVHLPKDLPHSLKNTGSSAGKIFGLLIPGGSEKVWEEISSKPPEPPSIDNINAITKKYGIEFLPLEKQ